MVRWVKFSVKKHADLSSDPQYPFKSWAQGLEKWLGDSSPPPRGNSHPLITPVLNDQVSS